MTTGIKSTKEIWKPIKGYEGIYEISNLGRVKSLKRISDKGYSVSERIPKLSFDKDGYPRTNLQKDEKRKTVKVHRLVATAFIPNPENKPQVNHINGVKNDNRVNNLEWATSFENRQHAYDTGLQKPTKGERSGCSKIKDIDVKSIRANSKYFTQRQLSNYFGLSQQQISDIIKRKYWTHI